MAYGQDDYLQKMGITKGVVQSFCDSVSERSIKIGYTTLNRVFDKNISIGKGEFYYVNNDSCYVYDLPDNFTGKKIAKLIFSDSIYVFKNAKGEPYKMNVYGDGCGGDDYYLCATKSGKLALFKNNDCISRHSLSLSPNSSYFLTENRFSSLLISRDWKKHIKIPTLELFWYPDHSQFLYNNCFYYCDTNIQILMFDLKTWKSSFIAKGISPTFISNYSSIIYFGDSIINGEKKECIFTKVINRGNIELFFQIPDSLTYWHDGDDYSSPSKITTDEIEGSLCYKISLCKKNQEEYCDHPYFYYIDENKNVRMIRKW